MTKHNFKKFTFFVIFLLIVALFLTGCGDSSCNHDWEEVKSVDATCESEGYIEYKCSICNEHKKEYTTNALGHDYVEIERVDASCTTDGFINYVCAHDGSHVKTDIISATGHDYEITNVEPTETTQGYTLHKCLICGDEFKSDFIDPISSEYVFDSRVDATCTTDGYVKYVNSNNSDDVIIIVLKATGHNYVDTVILPTCTTDGYTNHKCANCDDEYQDNIVNAFDHDYIFEGFDWSSDYQSALAIYVCSHDSNHTISYPAKVTSSICVKPTCLEKGTTVYTATYQNYSETKEIQDITALGHNFKELSYEWIGVDEVLIHLGCTGDSSHTLDVTATVETTTVEATCTANGTITYTGSVTYNGKTYSHSKVEIIERTEHIASDWIIDQEPTCLTAGSRHKECSVCHSILEKETLYAIGHNYTASFDWTEDLSAATLTLTCSNDESHVISAELISVMHVDKEATAEENGKNSYTVTYKLNSNTTYTDIKYVTVPAFGHSFVFSGFTWEGFTSASAIFTCTTEDNHVEIIEADITSSVVLDADCTHTGSVKYVASVQFNNENYSETKYDTLPILGHDFGEWTTVNEPTCTDKGLEERSCSRCSEKEYRDIDALGHSYISEITLPTCTEQGYTKHTCSRCNDSYVDSYTNALGHDFGEWTTVTEPTCTEKGLEERSCSRCSEKEYRDIDALGHSYTSEITLPTCTEQGYTTHTCSRCNDSYVDSYTNALGHDFGEWTTVTDPTCTEKGLEERSCSRCSEKEYRDIDALGHDYETLVFDPTCTEQGYTAHICSRCDDIYYDNYTDSLGHLEIIDEAIDPTCTDFGLTQGSHCGRCNVVLVEQTIVNALGHDFSVELYKIEPDCTNQGLVEYKCSRCDETDVLEIDPKGHDFILHEAVAATCESIGNIAYYECNNCHKLFNLVNNEYVEITLEDIIIAKTEHHFKEVEKNTTVSDTLNQSFTGVSGTSYTDWSGKQNSVATYEGQSAGGNSSIQLRSTNSNSGVITTISAGKVTKISVVWNSSTTTGRTLNIYGKNTAYTSPTDLYNSSTQGTLLGTIVCGTSTEIEISGYYDYIGFRSKSGALYLTSVTITWSSISLDTLIEEVSPTCTTNGLLAHYECENCGKSYKFENNEYVEFDPTILALGHDFGEWTIITNATCTTDGLKQHECSRCHLIEEEIIEALGHDLTHFDATEATENQQGNIEYWYCSVCQKYFSDENANQEISYELIVIPKLNHVHECTHYIAKEASCSENGNIEYWHCSSCNKYFSDNEYTLEISSNDTIILALGHDYTFHEAIDATCDSFGYSAYYECNDCHKLFNLVNNEYIEITLEDVIIAKTEHHFKAVETITTVSDTLNRSLTGVSGTSYTNWSGKQVNSVATYAGQSAGGNSSIQLRSNNNNSGVITTISAGKVTKISVVWNSSTTTGRTLNIYGKNTAYTSPTELYNSSAQGTLLGTIVYGTSTELEINGDYAYIGFRSNNGALYLTSVTITWSSISLDTLIEEVSPTCTTNGSLAHYECETCGKSYKYENNEYVEFDPTILALGHDFGEWEYTYAENGLAYLRTRVCKIDASHIDIQAFINENTNAFSDRGTFYMNYALPEDIKGDNVLSYTLVSNPDESNISLSGNVLAVNHLTADAIVLVNVTCESGLSHNIIINIEGIADEMDVFNVTGTKINSIKDEYKDLVTLVIPDSVTRVDDGALNGMSKLVNITVPFTGRDYSTTSANYTQYVLFARIFGSSSFANSTNVTQTNFKYNKDNGDAYKYIVNSPYTDWYVPSSLRYIRVTQGTSYTKDEETFYRIYTGSLSGLTMVETIIIDDHITNINYGALFGTSNLKTLSVPFMGETGTSTADNTSHNNYPGWFFATGNDSELFTTNMHYTSSNSNKISEIPNTLETIIIRGGNINGSVFRNYTTSQTMWVRNIVLYDSVNIVGGYNFNANWTNAALYIQTNGPTISSGLSGNGKYSNITKYQFSVNATAEVATGSWWYFDTDGYTIKTIVNA